MSNWERASRHSYPSLKGRNAIVTGGGRGLGRVLALALVEQGANVMITGARAGAELDATSAEANGLGGGRCIGLLADVSDYDSCKTVVRKTESEFGSVDILVNNAARGPLEQLDEAGLKARLAGSLPTQPQAKQSIAKAGRFWESDVEGTLRMLSANFAGPFLMAHASVPGMVERGFGRIINISVSRPTMVRLGGGVYGPLKAALEASSRIWAAELEGTGVTVNVLLPGGAADTAAIPGVGVGTRAKPFNPGEAPRGQEGIADGLLPPKIMGPPMIWLASNESEHATGRRFSARDWNDAISPAEAAAYAETDHIDWPHII